MGHNSLLTIPTVEIQLHGIKQRMVAMFADTQGELAARISAALEQELREFDLAKAVRDQLEPGLREHVQIAVGNAVFTAVRGALQDPMVARKLRELIAGSLLGQFGVPEEQTDES